MINRKEFNCWGQLPKVGQADEYAGGEMDFKEARKVRQGDLGHNRQGVNVDMVFEHPGEATFPVSTLVCKKGAWW